jgi:UDP-N-acetylmuramoyl-tripeptide--D-alanyl-D-alanine ligase
MAGQWVVPPAHAARDGAGLVGISTDSRACGPSLAFIALRGERTDGHRHLADAARAGCRLVVVHEPIAATELPPDVAVMRVNDTGEALLTLARAYRRTLAARVIAVGGSNGKTTTVRLIAAALGERHRGTASQKSFNNAVGVPLTILSAKPDDAFLICEVGTNAPGEVAPLTAAIEPDIIVITSIGREHLEGLGSLEGVIAEEASLARGMRPSGLAIVTGDSPELVSRVRTLLASIPGARVQTFGTSQGCDLQLRDSVQSESAVRFAIGTTDAFEVSLPGVHNASNAAAAIAVARELGVDDDVIRRGLASASGPPMRLERSTIAGVTIINDAYNANPDSMLASLRTFAAMCDAAGVAPAGTTARGRRVVVLGDMLEMGEAGPMMHREVGESLAAAGWADLIVLIGPLMLFASTALAKRYGTQRVVHVSDLESGTADEIASMFRPADWVLLKGSRGMRLERVLEAWKARSAPAAAGQ